MTLVPAPTTAESNDPLVTAAERLPQARPRFAPSLESGSASPTSHRPFGLRFAVPPGNAPAALPAWRYCPARQITVDAEGHPRHRQIADMTMNTSGPSKDGTGNTGGEEWSPDYLADEPA